LDNRFYYLYDGKDKIKSPKKEKRDDYFEMDFFVDESTKFTTVFIDKYRNLEANPD
jgi:hypothetical protein